MDYSYSTFCYLKNGEKCFTIIKGKNDEPFFEDINKSEPLNNIYELCCLIGIHGHAGTYDEKTMYELLDQAEEMVESRKTPKIGNK